MSDTRKQAEECGREFSILQIHQKEVPTLPEKTLRLHTQVVKTLDESPKQSLWEMTLF